MTRLFAKNLPVLWKKRIATTNNILLSVNNPLQETRFRLLRRREIGGLLVKTDLTGGFHPPYTKFSRVGVEEGAGLVQNFPLHLLGKRACPVLDTGSGVCPECNRRDGALCNNALLKQNSLQDLTSLYKSGFYIYLPIRLYQF